MSRLDPADRHGIETAIAATLAADVNPHDRVRVFAERVQRALAALDQAEAELALIVDVHERARERIAASTAVLAAGHGFSAALETAEKIDRDESAARALGYASHAERVDAEARERRDAHLASLLADEAVDTGALEPHCRDGNHLACDSCACACHDPDVDAPR